MGVLSILVVDDDEGVRETLADYLSMQGYEIGRAASGAELEQALAAGRFELVMLDVNLPGEDGFSILRRLRQRHAVPVIMVTAAGTIIDRVAGLEAGADDYVVKPFDLKEVRARVRAVLRRYDESEEARRDATVTPEAGSERAATISLGHVEIDLEGHRLVSGGEATALTLSELGLLRAFAGHPYTVLSRERLRELAGEMANAAEGRGLDIRIARLRKKIEPDPAHPTILRTVRGAGYLFAPPRRPQ